MIFSSIIYYNTLFVTQFTPITKIYNNITFFSNYSILFLESQISPLNHLLLIYDETQLISREKLKKF